MQKHETKIWNRLVAFLLSFVMVLGMLPANTVRAEETSDQTVEETSEVGIETGTDTDTDIDTDTGTETVALGTVETLTPGGLVTENTVTFTGITLEWVGKDESIGRNWDGWWVGIKVIAPAGADLALALYGRTGAERTSFQADALPEGSEYYLPLWVLINEEYAAKYETINYSWQFDWNGDGTEDQTVKISVDTKTLTLLDENGEQVFPIAVTVSHGDGQLLDAEGNKLETGNYAKGTILTFTYQLAEGFQLVDIKAGDQKLEADENGVYTVTVNEDTAIVAETKDVQAPVFGDVTVSNADVWAMEKTISFTVTDNASVEKVYISESSDYGSATDLEEVELKDGAYSCEVAKTAKYYLYAVDAADNAGTSSVEVKNIDTTHPEVSDWEIPGDDNRDGWPDNGIWVDEVTVSFAVKDDESGISKVYLSKSEDFSNSDTVTEVQFNEETQKYEFDADDKTTYYILAVDNAGNYVTDSQKLPYVYVGIIDSALPTVTLPDDICTNEKSVTIEATFNDQQFGAVEGSGVVALYYTTEESTKDSRDPNATKVDIKTNQTSYDIPGPKEDNFEGTYYVWVEDAAGKLSDVAKINVVKDTTAPVLESVQFTEQPGQFIDELPKELGIKYTKHTWLYYTNEIEIRVKATDNLSGIGTYWYNFYPENGSLDKKAWQKAENVTIDEENGTARFTVTKEDGFRGKIVVYVTDKAGNNEEFNNRNAKFVAEYTPYNNPETGGKACWVYIDSKNNSTPVTKVLMTTEDGEYDETWTNQNVVITLNSTIIHGVKRYEHLNDDGEWETLAELNSTTKDNNEYTLTIQGNTNKTYSFRAVSSENVTGPEVNVVVKIHQDAPDEATLTIISKAEGKNGWYTAAPDINITPAVNKDNEPMVTTVFAIEKDGYKSTEREWIDWSEIVHLKELLKGMNSETDNEEAAKEDGRFTLYVKTYDEAGNVTTTFLDMTGVEEAPETGEGTETEGETPVEPAAGEHRTELHFNIDTTAPTDLTITCTYRVTEREKKDENGETVLDEHGNPVMEPILDENRNPTTEEVTDNLLDNPEDDMVIFNRFYSNTITIKLAAEFGASGKDKDSLKYLILPDYGAYTEKQTAYEADPNLWTDYEDGVDIKPNEKFVLIFRAEDAAGHVSYAHSTGIVVDNEAPSADESKAPGAADTAVAFDIPEANKYGFYVDESGFEIGVSVFDPIIEDASLGGDNNNASGLKRISYILKTVEESGLSKSGTLELATRQNGKVIVDTKYFDGYTVYLEVTAVDNAGNSKLFTSEEMKIDITDPKVSVDFNPTTGTDGTEYFNAQRTATVTVEERNFDSKNTIVTISAKLDGRDIEKPEVNFVQDTENKDIWIATIPFNTDGTYTFEVDVTDLAGHNVPDEEVDYGESQHVNTFVIDLTDPVIHVTYDLNNPTNGKYFNAVRTARVEVIERNFTRDGARLNISASLDGQPVELPTGVFEHIGGNTYVATVEFDQDADYSFGVSVTDRAGNSSTTNNDEFTIDKTIEAPTVGGVENGGAYKDEAAPSVDIYDVNYERYTLTLTRTNMQVKDEVVTEEFFELIEFTAPGGTLNTEDIPHLQENDGIYTLTVDIYDLAGNTTTTVTTFTVNRFGSVYVPGEYLRDSVMDQFIQAVEEDLVLTEYNPDKLKDDSVQIEITRDGKPLDDVAFTATPTPNDMVAYGASGWYEYVYTISKDNFAEDGVYKISILSKDKTGNECQSDTITFRVDKTVPELSSVVGLEDRIINAQELDVKYNVFDAIGLESIEILVNGEIVERITDFEDPNNFSGSFQIMESNDTQTVQIIIKDLAGNILDTNAKEFTSAYKFNRTVTVSTNWFVRWFANKPLFFGSLVGGGAGLWLLWFLIFGKRKKKDGQAV